MLENLRRDAEKYSVDGGWYRSPGFWIVANYRLEVWAHAKTSGLVRMPLLALSRLLRIPLWFLKVSVWGGPAGARIGAGLRLIHPANIVIGSGSEIGEDCLIFHEVTIGAGPLPGRPKIGNNVNIYVGARILGGVNIGDNCMIGANCVVTRDVPAGSVVVTSPCRVISRSLSAVARGADESKTASTDVDGLDHSN
jgi:serine acetyltransferase